MQGFGGVVIGWVDGSRTRRHGKSGHQISNVIILFLQCGRSPSNE